MKYNRKKKEKRPNSYFLTPNSSKQGQVIVELMVASSVLMVGLLGIFATLSRSLALNRVAANQYIASNLAAEGVEVVKNILDANAIPSNGRAWNEFLNYGGEDYFGVQYDTTGPDLGGARSNAGKMLRYNPANGRYSYDSGDETNFIRVVTIDNVDDEITVTSRVKWTDRGGADFEVDVEDVFRNWRP